jgi:hypothetical protein
MEAKLALTEVALQSDDKLAAKNPPEHRDGEKEARVRWNPTRVIERQSTCGHHTMGKGVMFEFLIPGVEHTEEADFGAEMLGIASEFEESFGVSLNNNGTGFSRSASDYGPVLLLMPFGFHRTVDTLPSEVLQAVA